MKKEEAVWAVVYMARRRDRAEEVRALLEGEGFLVRTHPEGQESASGAFELMCLIGEAREARAFLTENGIA